MVKPSVHKLLLMYTQAWSSNPGSVAAFHEFYEKLRVRTDTVLTVGVLLTAPPLLSLCFHCCHCTPTAVTVLSLFDRDIDLQCCVDHARATSHALTMHVQPPMC